MLLRNRKLLGSVAAWCLIAFASAVLFGIVFGPYAAICALASVILGGAPLLAHSLWRYRKIAALSEGLDELMHANRPLDLDTMDEGELSILANELGKMVTALEIACEELEHERTRLADALADISHQLRTPLTSLSIATELLRMRLTEHGGCEGELERLRTIEKLQLHVEQLVNALLKLARLDAGQLHLEKSEVSVATLAKASFEPLAIGYDIAGVSFECKVEGDVRYTGDAAWSAEAIGNVLKNCMEHTPHGGTVRLTAWEDALACRIRIEDSGPGFAEEDLAHAFERFYRGGSGNGGAQTAGSEPSSAVNPAGVGIGLALARALIEAQNGTIIARNATDAAGNVTGARFDISFYKDAAI